MKKLIMAVIVCLTFSTTAIHAETRISLGGNVGYFHYKETQYDTTLCKDYGFLPGVNAGVLFKKKAWWIRGTFDLNLTHGATYKGQTQTGEPLKFDNEHETIWTIEGNIGYTFAADLTWGILDITPYTGVGYRHWTRGQADAETGNYEEAYKWVFLPVGVNIIYNSDIRPWSAGVDLAVLFPLSPKLDVHLHELDPAFEDVKLEPQWRPGFRIQIPLFYKFSPHWAVYVVPRYTYWALEESKIEEQTGWQLYEPASSTHHFTVKIGISYSF